MESKAAILEVLYDVILETPSVVWTIHNTYFSTIVGELLDDFDNMTVSIYLAYDHYRIIKKGYANPKRA